MHELFSNPKSIACQEFNHPQENKFPHHEKDTIENTKAILNAFKHEFNNISTSLLQLAVNDGNKKTNDNNVKRDKEDALFLANSDHSSLYWILGFLALVFVVVAIVGTHAWIYRRDEKRMKIVPLTFVPTHTFEKTRQFTQRGMRVSWSSWASSAAIVIFLIACLVQVFVSIVISFPTAGNDMDTRNDYKDPQFEANKNFFRCAGRLAVLAIACVAFAFWWSMKYSETFRIYWMTPTTLNQAEFVMINEVTDQNEIKKEKSSKFNVKSKKKEKIDESLRAQMLRVQTFKETRYIHFCGIRYPWNETTKCFEPCPPPECNYLDIECLNQGVTEKEAVDRRTGVGPNEVMLHPAFSFSVIILRTLLSPFFVFPLLGNMVQLLDMGLSLQRDVPDIVKTIIFLAFVAIFWIWVEWYSALEIRNMLERNRTKVRVLRGSCQWQQCDSTELVPGDVIQLQEADVVPADAILIEGGVMVDESALTGEPLPVAKSTANSQNEVRKLITPTSVNTNTNIAPDSHKFTAIGKTPERASEHGLAFGHKLELDNNTVKSHVKGRRHDFRRGNTHGPLGAFSSTCMLPGITPFTKKEEEVFKEEKKSIKDRCKSLKQCDNMIQHASILSAGSIVTEGQCRALVTRTGGWSSQGALLRAALFARRCNWKAERTQIHLLFFGFILLYFMSMYRRVNMPPVDGNLGKLFESWENVVWLFNPIGDMYKIFRPEWPLGMAVVSLLASSRLKRIGVKSVDLDSNSVAGGVTTCVFDKTGTITSKNLHMKGIHPFVGTAFLTDKSPYLWVDKLVLSKNEGWVHQLPEHLRDAINECVLLENKAHATRNNDNNDNDRRGTSISRRDTEYVATSSDGTTPGGKKSRANSNWTGVDSTGSCLEGIDEKTVYFNDERRKSSICTKQSSICSEQTEVWQEETAYLLRANRGLQLPGENDLSDESSPKIRAEIAGNPVDAEIFRATMLPRRSTRIIRRFSFDHARQTSGVVSSDLQTGKRLLVCKGAFRRMAQLADIIPQNYLEIAEGHAKNGRYVLAIGARELKDYEDVVERDAIERNLRLLGLLVFENHVKPDSKASLQEIFDGGVRPLICTGDNELAGAAVARQIGLLPATALLATEWDGEVNWSPMLQPEDQSYDELERSNVSERSIESAMAKTSAPNKPALVLTGAALRVLYKNKQLSDILPDVRVVANATAADKLLLVRALQEEGEIVGMCGDGWNDAGALRQAHIGVVLRVSNISRICAFSAKDDSLSVMPELFKVSRCCVATCIEVATYCVVLGLCSAFSSIIWHVFHVLLKPRSTFYNSFNWTVAFYDNIMIILAFVALFWRKPKHTLWFTSNTGEFFNFKRAISIVGLMLLVVSSYIANVLFLRTWSNYLPGGLDEWMKDLPDNVPIYETENSPTVEKNDQDFKFLKRWNNYDSSAMQLRKMTEPLLCLFILSADKRWAAPFWKHWAYVSVLVFSTATLMILIWSGPNYLTCQFGVNCSNSWSWENMGQCFYGPQLEVWHADVSKSEFQKTPPPLPENRCMTHFFNDDIKDASGHIVHGDLNNEWPIFMKLIATLGLIFVGVGGFFLSRSWYKIPKLCDKVFCDKRRKSSLKDLRDYQQFSENTNQQIRKKKHYLKQQSGGFSERKLIMNAQKSHPSMSISKTTSYHHPSGRGIDDNYKQKLATNHYSSVNINPNSYDSKYEVNSSKYDVNSRKSSDGKKLKKKRTRTKLRTDGIHTDYLLQQTLSEKDLDDQFHGKHLKKSHSGKLSNYHGSLSESLYMLEARGNRMKRNNTLSSSKSVKSNKSHPSNSNYKKSSSSKTLRIVDSQDVDTFDHHDDTRDHQTGRDTRRHDDGDLNLCDYLKDDSFCNDDFERR